MEAASKTIANYRANIDSDNKRKAAKKEADKNTLATDFYNVGDIIVNSWGWEQTNIDFYQVVKTTKKCIFAEEIGQTVEKDSEYSHGMACNVLPTQNQFVKNGDKYRLTVKANGALSNPASYYYMHKWDGRPMYKSWYA